MLGKLPTISDEFKKHSAAEEDWQTLYRILGGTYPAVTLILSPSSLTEILAA